MPCISFIVPVYNMERLLPRALRSLRAQTLTDFEAILINDGSKDGSAALCAQAVAEDARFRFIDQPNGGVAAARNAGLDAARGEYIFFLDPDDWVEPDAAEVLYHAARNADADCAPPRTAAPRCVHRLLPRMRAFASSTSPTAA